MRVLNIGSMNLDHVYTVDHVVQPGETEASLDMNVFLGGKGMNQSVALAKAGVPTYQGGMIGPTASPSWMPAPNSVSMPTTSAALPPPRVMPSSRSTAAPRIAFCSTAAPTSA